MNTHRSSPGDSPSRLARTTNRSLSGLFREGLKRIASEQFWQRAHAIAQPKAETLGIAEDDVTHLAREYRKEKRAKNGKKKS